MLIIVHFYSEASLLSLYNFANYMNIQKEITDKSTGNSSKVIPVLSEYAKSLESRVKERYTQKISVIGVDPAKHTSRAVQSRMLASCGSLGLAELPRS